MNRLSNGGMKKTNLNKRLFSVSELKHEKPANSLISTAKVGGQYTDIRNEKQANQYCRIARRLLYLAT